jgi:hypothetical protein
MTSNAPWLLLSSALALLLTHVVWHGDWKVISVPCFMTIAHNLYSLIRLHHRTSTNVGNGHALVAIVFFAFHAFLAVFSILFVPVIFMIPITFGTQKAVAYTFMTIFVIQLPQCAVLYHLVTQTCRSTTGAEDNIEHGSIYLPPSSPITEPLICDPPPPYNPNHRQVSEPM